ncbi:MAG: hypothetical protein H6677_27340 [Candidatus Obscuribacterales bacterium]|nr:hypothetical protein [Candidatus Obscuribacterales bacterium]
MIWCNAKHNLIQGLMAILLISFCLVGCGSGTTGDSGAVTPQGTIDLDNLKVGVPENIIEGAVLSFQLDENPISRVGGKNQYLSITKDKSGGTYIAQCKDGYCYQLQALYTESPVSKEQALAAVKSMLPSSAPEQSKVDTSELDKGDSKYPKMSTSYGDSYLSELYFTDSTGEKVKLVNVWDLKKAGENSPFAKGDAKAQAEGSKEKTSSN